MRRQIALLGTILLLAGCQAPQQQRPAWWLVGFTEPAYMKVWVETLDAEDIQGQLFHRIGAGTAAGGEPKGDAEYARGWLGVGSSVYPAVGADLPKRLFVRWQSVAESRTYRTWIEIPEQARRILRQSTTALCPDDPHPMPMGGGGRVTLGLAPGGIVQVWVRDECLRPIKVARAQAEVEPLGPHQGESDGHYYPQSDASKRYIERWGIPYGSW
ncbi:DUF2931 family protein [Pseudomonas sp. UL073]|uniref:DUF2931 family protein n=1 Tax=Zestomonas insulae TaxID=2809017 RepID=A0ABS2IHP4_9GAMM|nr:DUF2931 family protein [Pseudomonas insulae]MBM7062591.1 DUF2931 family protein [Pseudomonas insulae]